MQIYYRSINSIYKYVEDYMPLRMNLFKLRKL